MEARNLKRNLLLSYVVIIVHFMFLVSSEAEKYKILGESLKVSIIFF